MFAIFDFFDIFKETKLLKKNIQDLKKLNDDLTTENNRLITVIKDSVVKSHCSIDFDKINAFSIERLYCEDTLWQVCTIIGYIKPDKSNGQWYLYCSQEEHNRLVKEFKLYKNAVNE